MICQPLVSVCFIGLTYSAILQQFCDFCICLNFFRKQRILSFYHIHQSHILHFRNHYHFLANFILINVLVYLANSELMHLEMALILQQLLTDPLSVFYSLLSILFKIVKSIYMNLRIGLIFDVA